MKSVADRKYQKPKRRGGKPKSRFLRFIKGQLYVLYWTLFPQDKKGLTWPQLIWPFVFVLVLLVVIGLVG